MPELIDILHDGLDDQEELGERARLVVEGLKARLPAIVSGAQSFDEGLELAAAMVADELADVTTAAVQSGRRLAERLVK